MQHHLSLAGAWSFRVRPDLGYATFYAMTSGSAWLWVDPARPIRLGPGSAALVNLGVPHVLSRKRHLSPVDAREFFAHCESPFPLQLRSGEGPVRTELVTGFCRFARPELNPLLDSLPALLSLSASPLSENGGSSDAGHAVTELGRELKQRLPGRLGVANRLAEVLLIRLIRSWLTTPQAASTPGLVGGLGEPALSRALEAVHRAPGSPWTVNTLAKHVGLSRTGFATLFSARVGIGPASYLRRLRLHQACELLETTAQTSAQIGAQVGYESEAAFNRVFRRELGVTPARFRRRIRERG